MKPLLIDTILTLFSGDAYVQYTLGNGTAFDSARPGPLPTAGAFRSQKLTRPCTGLPMSFIF